MDDLEQKIEQGISLSVEEVVYIAKHLTSDELYEMAHKVTIKFASRLFDLCSIVNVKSGHYNKKDNNINDCFFKSEERNNEIYNGKNLNFLSKFDDVPYIQIFPNENLAAGNGKWSGVNKPIIAKDSNGSKYVFKE